MSKAVLISIHPEHVAKILSGDKVFEYRKVMPSQDISHLMLYSTAPVNMIVAVAEVTSLLKGPPSRIWNETAYGAGVTRKHYREYFSGYKSAGSFALGNVFELSDPVTLAQLSSCAVPPQSFCYLDPYDTREVLKKASSVPSNPSSLVFVGGIHGVGKTTICQKTFTPFGYRCVSASSLISAYGRSTDINKRVDDVSGNQLALIEQLSLEKKKHRRLLLDGHFTLMNSRFQIEPIELWVFEKINPTRLILISGNPNETTRRLAARDGRKWNLADVVAFQEAEKRHAMCVSNHVGIPLQIFDNTISYAELAKSVRKRHET